MISFWFKNILSQGPEGLMQGAKAFEKKVRQKLIDVAEDVTGEIPSVEDVRRQSQEFMGGLLHSGNPIDRLRLWLSTRRKVRRNLGDSFDFPDLAEEVTEKLVEASMEDPRLQRLFQRSKH